MTVQLVSNQHRQVAIDMVTPAAQNSTNVDVPLAGSEMDVRAWKSLAYTLKVATAAVTWTVFGANFADYSDEVIVQTAASVNAGANASYSVERAPYAYYRVKIRSTVADTPGSAILVGIAKG